MFAGNLCAGGGRAALLLTLLLAVSDALEYQSSILKGAAGVPTERVDFYLKHQQCTAELTSDTLECVTLSSLSLEVRDGVPFPHVVVADSLAVATIRRRPHPATGQCDGEAPVVAHFACDPHVTPDNHTHDADESSEDLY